MPASSGTHIQTPIPSNLKQYNAAQPDVSCKTTIDMAASQPCSRTLTYLHYNNAAGIHNHHAIQNQTPTSQHSNHHLHHTSHSEYSTLKPAICPHKCIQIIFLPKHHQTMEQPTVMFSDKHYNLPTIYMFITIYYDTLCVNVFSYISIISNVLM